MMQTSELKDAIIKLKVGSKEKEYKLKCKFFSEETGKEYWVYTDDIKDKNGNIELKVSFVTKEKNKVSLVPCKEPSEINLVINMYEALKQHVDFKNE